MNPLRFSSTRPHVSGSLRHPHRQPWRGMRCLGWVQRGEMPEEDEGGLQAAPLWGDSVTGATLIDVQLQNWPSLARPDVDPTRPSLLPDDQVKLPDPPPLPTAMPPSPSSGTPSPTVKPVVDEPTFLGGPSWQKKADLDLDPLKSSEQGWPDFRTGVPTHVAPEDAYDRGPVTPNTPAPFSQAPPVLHYHIDTGAVDSASDDTPAHAPGAAPAPNPIVSLPAAPRPALPAMIHESGMPRAAAPPALDPNSVIDTDHIAQSIQTGPGTDEQKAAALARLAAQKKATAEAIYHTMAQTPDIKAFIDSMPGDTPEEKATNFARQARREGGWFSKAVERFHSGSDEAAAGVLGAVRALTGLVDKSTVDYWRNRAAAHELSARLMPPGKISDWVSGAAHLAPSLLAGVAGGPVAGTAFFGAGAGGDTFTDAEETYRRRLQPLVDQGKMTAQQADAQAHRQAYLPALGSAAANTLPFTRWGGKFAREIVRLPANLQRGAMQEALRQRLLRSAQKIGAAAIQNGVAALSDEAIATMTHHPERTLAEIADHVVSSAKLGGALHAAHEVRAGMPTPGAAVPLRENVPGAPAPRPRESVFAGQPPSSPETYVAGNPGTAETFTHSQTSGGGPGGQEPPPRSSKPGESHPASPRPQPIDLSKEPPLPISFVTKDTGTLAMEKGRLRARGYRPPEVTEFLNRYFKPKYFSDLAGEGGAKNENNVYLVMPSTSKSNLVPKFLADRLRKNFGGQILSEDKYAEAKSAIEAKRKEGYIAKMESPSSMIMLDPDLGEKLKDKNVIIVDDIVTTGESIEALEMSLAKIGVRVNGIAALGDASNGAVLHPNHPLVGQLASILDRGTTSPKEEIIRDIQIAHPRSRVNMLDRATKEANANAGPVRAALGRRARDVRPPLGGTERNLSPRRVLPLPAGDGRGNPQQIRPLLPTQQQIFPGSGPLSSSTGERGAGGGSTGQGTSQGSVSPPRLPSSQGKKDLEAAPIHPRRSKLKGRPGLEHLPDHGPAREQECYTLLRQAVAVYQNLYPVLWRRFRRGNTSGRSGLETQFRDASGRITPSSVRHACVAVQEDKLAMDLRGLSQRQTVFHMEHALGEEVRHLASLQAALALWEHSGGKIALEPWLTGYFSQMWQRDFAPPLRTAILHAYAGNYGDPSRAHKMTYLPQDWQLAFEGLRMLSQARAGTLPTEADQLWHWPKHDRHPLPMLIYFIQQAALSGKLSPKIEWMLRAIDQLMRSVSSGPGVQRSGLGTMRRAA